MTKKLKPAKPARLAKTAKPVQPANRAFYHFLRFTLGNWVKWKFRVHYNTTAIEGLKPPFLLIGNHSFNWDAFIISLPFHHPVHFVSSDEYFRSPIIGMLFKAIGGIPKAKNVRDTSTVRTMLALKKHGVIFGIYPEGNRNWDGVTGPLYTSTAKLIRLFQIPVVAATTTGNALYHPRWAKHHHRGPLFLDFHILFTPEDCKVMKESELAVAMRAALLHDDYLDIKGKAKLAGLVPKYSGKKLAENLERFLFLCPDCKRADTMSSKADRFFCTACDFSVRYGTDGHFHEEPRTGNPGNTDSNPLPFQLTKSWNLWQLEHLHKAMKTPDKTYINTQRIMHKKTGAGHITVEKENSIDGINDECDFQPEKCYLHNEDACLKTGGRTGPFRKRGFGSLSLKENSLVFQPYHNNKNRDPNAMVNLVLPFEKMSGLNIQFNRVFEFYCFDVLYRFSFPKKMISIWKWHQALLYKEESLGID